MPVRGLKAIATSVMLALVTTISSHALHAQRSAVPSIDSLKHKILKVKPSDTHAAIRAWDTTHVVYYDPTITSNKLMVWMAGTNGTPLSIPTELFNTALAQGYRIIALSYITVPAVSQVCVREMLEANVNCAEMFRRKRIYGDNAFSAIPDEAHDAIIPRLVRLLQWLSTHDAGGEWSRYLTADASKPNWSSIAVMGQSQGGGMAQFIAQQETVARVISFSGGWDYANSGAKTIAGWYSKQAATPMERWFATYNINEVAARTLSEISTTLRIPATQIFALDKPLLNPGAASTSANPFHGDGIRNPVYKPIWLTMFGNGRN